MTCDRRSWVKNYNVGGVGKAKRTAKQTMMRAAKAIEERQAIQNHPTEV